MNKSDWDGIDYLRGRAKIRVGDIHSVKSGDKRVSYRPRRPWLDRLYFVAVLGWGIVMGFVAFSQGVDRGTTIGIESCRAGDSVAVDPAVSGAVH